MIASAASLFLAAALLPSGMTPSDEGILHVRVSNVRNANGQVHIDICPQAMFLKENCPYSAAAPAQTGVTIVTAHNVPPGHYAVQAFHDENANHKVDRALFGIPKEGVGFSNDAPIHLSAPKFADAAFDFAGGDQTIGLKMRYFLGASGPKNR